MNFLSTFEVSEKWGISPRRILNLIKSGRVPEAVFDGSRWLIPADLKKPADGRTKAGKVEKKETDNFRYPLYEYKDLSSFNPPLSEEELTLKAVIEAVNACRFDDAAVLLEDFPERAQNRYIRITALYCRCMTGIYFCDIKRFLNCFGMLKTELQEDFPHKAEMSEFIHEIEATIGNNDYYANEFQNKFTYKFHRSFLPRLCNLSSVWLIFGEKQITTADLNLYELNCALLENTDNYFDLQAIHINLGCAYAFLNKKEERNYHFRKALALAEEFDMFYCLVVQYKYMRSEFNEALNDFSDDLRQKLDRLCNEISKNFIRFNEDTKYNSIYKMLAEDDYIYVAFAVQGLTNKEIAKRMHISVSTVGNRYGAIYAKLNVETKDELINLYHSAITLPWD